MNARRKGWISLLALLAIACVATALFASRDRIAEIWHLRALESEQPRRRQAAASALVELRSARAVRPLLHLALAAREPQSARSPEGDLARESAPAREYWLDSIRAIGSRAIPPLLDAYTEPAGYGGAIEERQELIAALLFELSPEANTAARLVDALEDESASALVPWVAASLGRLGESAQNESPRLLRLARTARADVRRAALVALRGVLSAEAWPLGVLLELLEDSDAAIRAEAAFTIGHLAPAIHEPALAGMREQLETLATGGSGEDALHAEWALDRLEATRTTEISR